MIYSQKILFVVEVAQTILRQSSVTTLKAITQSRSLRQRGANENLNGLIRQYIPKKTDFDHIDDDFKIKLNNRPRKRFNFESPQQRFDNLLLVSA